MPNEARGAMPVLLLCLLAWGLCSAVAAAADDAVSFQDKTITLLIGNAAGGTTDLYGRLLGQHLVAHMPGNPRLVVLNQPGAEGVTALNGFVTRAKPDGLTATVGAASQSDPLVTRTAHAIYDVRKFVFAGGLAHTGTMLFIDKEARNRLEDKRAEPVTMGALSQLRTGMYMTLWGTEFLGWNTRWVMGYPSTAGLRQALERGEIDMTSFGSANDIRQLIAAGRFAILVQSGMPEGDRLLPRPDSDDAPILGKLLGGRLTDPVAQRAFAYWEKDSLVGIWLALPPGTPEAVAEVYRTAMHAALADADYRAAVQAIEPDAVEMSAAEVHGLLTALAETPPEALAYLEELQKKQGIARKP